MVAYKDFEALVIILVCGVLGIVNAMIFNTMNTEGIIIDSFVSGNITILDIMTYTIILWLLVGIIIAAVKK